MFLLFFRGRITSALRPRASASPIPCPLLALPSGPTIPLRSIVIAPPPTPASPRPSHAAADLHPALILSRAAADPFSPALFLS
jgi:hypothetical protein